MFIDSCIANCLFFCNSTPICNVYAGESYVCLIFLHSCAHSCIRSTFSGFGFRLSCHACIKCSSALLRHDQVRSAMFDNVVFQHEGLSWKIGCRPLRGGSAFFMMHTVLFRAEPAHVRDSIVVCMDLETNSLDVVRIT